jgi:hypothetical protein
MVAQKKRLTYKDVVATLPTLEMEEQINLVKGKSIFLDTAPLIYFYIYTVF